MKDNETSIVRGCGTRKKGGIYFVVKLGQNGAPPETFLVDYPLPITEGSLPKLGVKIAQQQDRTYVIDGVGKQYYPTARDFYEEFIRKGISRRVSKSLDFKHLTGRVYLALWHDYVVPDFEDENTLKAASKAYQNNLIKCPKDLDHPFSESVLEKKGCLGLAWSAIPESGVFTDEITRKTMRKFVDFEYQCNTAMSGTSFKPGFFLIVPVSGIEVVDDPENGIQEQIEAVQKAELPFEIVKE